MGLGRTVNWYAIWPYKSIPSKIHPPLRSNKRKERVYGGGRRSWFQEFIVTRSCGRTGYFLLDLFHRLVSAPANRVLDHIRFNKCSNHASVIWLDTGWSTALSAYLLCHICSTIFSISVIIPCIDYHTEHGGLENHTCSAFIFMVWWVYYDFPRALPTWRWRACEYSNQFRTIQKYCCDRANYQR